MPRKLKKCLDCDNLTNGLRCKKCSGEHRKIYLDQKLYRKEWQFKKKYNLDEGEFDALWVIFQGKCGICGKLMKLPQSTQGQTDDTVTVDHDHKTGIVRGLLCFRCNKGIGHFQDNTKLLLNAAKYLGYKNE